jgi:hypothetical protein
MWWPSFPRLVARRTRSVFATICVRGARARCRGNILHSLIYAACQPDLSRLPHVKCRSSVDQDPSFPPHPWQHHTEPGHLSLRYLLLIQMIAVVSKPIRLCRQTSRLDRDVIQTKATKRLPLLRVILSLSRFVDANVSLLWDTRFSQLDIPDIPDITLIF